MTPDDPPPTAAAASAGARPDAVAAHRSLHRLAARREAPWLHEEAACRMAERLGWIKYQPAQVLDWSGAAGSAAALLAQAYPGAQQFQLVEAAMPAPRRAPWWRRWAGQAAEPQGLSAAEVEPARAGLVWSNMRLHFEPDPRPLLEAWHRALMPGGFLMFSTLGPGSLGLLRELYGQAGWGHAHSPFVDMHDLGDMMVAAGFQEPVMDQETLTLSYSSPEALLEELRSLGSNLSSGRFAGLRTPRWRDALHGALRDRADGQGRIALQLELVYGHAFRALHTAPRVAEQTQIGLEEMKLMLRNPKGRE